MGLDLNNKHIKHIVLPTNQLSFNKWIEHVHKEAAITRMSGLNRLVNRSTSTDAKEYLRVKPILGGFKELSLGKVRKMRREGKVLTEGSKPPKNRQ